MTTYDSERPLPLEAFAAAAERAAAEGLTNLWRALRLRSKPPRWSEAELLSACQAVHQTAREEPARAMSEARMILRRVAARRLAERLVEELGTCREGTWRLILGERYASVAHRCAPRKGLRRGTLAGAVAADPRLRADLADRLAEWFRLGAPMMELADIAEAVLVHHRTPARRA
jgi:hypothetical protein